MDYEKITGKLNIRWLEWVNVYIGCYLSLEKSWH